MGELPSSPAAPTNAVPSSEARNSALEATFEMAGITSQVTLLSPGDWSGDAFLQDKVNASTVNVMQGFSPAR